MKAAWTYFKKKCDPEAGEKMYKTFTGVKSVQVVKPLPPATDKDHFDQFRVGDAYSAAATSLRTDLSISNLVWGNGPNSSKSRGAGFGYAELVVPGADRIILKYYDPKGARDHTRQKVDRAISRVGISWEDISTREDRKYWVAGSRLRVVDIIDKSVIAERIGYFIESGFGSIQGGRRPWLTARGPNTMCPEAHDYTDLWFLVKALNPSGKSKNGK